MGRPRRLALRRRLVALAALATAGSLVASTVDAGVGTERADPVTAVATAATPVATGSDASVQAETSTRRTPSAGRLDLLLHAKSRFDPWTAPTDSATWSMMRRTYDAMVVYSPYFDRRQAMFDRAYVYRDLYAIKVSSSRDTRAAEHPEWILRTASGAPAYIPFACGGAAGCPQYAAHVAHPGYQADFLAHVRRLVDAGYDHLMIDDVNLLQRFSDRSGRDLWPIDPRTGREMTLTRWRADVVALLERVRAAFPRLEIMHNSIWYADSPGFDDRHVDRQIAASDHLMLERGANDRGLTGGDGRYSYAALLRSVDRAHRLGAGVLFLDETATTEREQTFNLATALLVNDGGDMVSTEDASMIAPGSVWPGFAVDLGDAHGDRRRDGSIWRREFTFGLVLANEPGGAARTLSLGGRFRTRDGSVVTSVRLREREAVVLWRTCGSLLGSTTATRSPAADDGVEPALASSALRGIDANSPSRPRPAQRC